MACEGAPPRLKNASEAVKPAVTVLASLLGVESARTFLVIAGKVFSFSVLGEAALGSRDSARRAWG